LNLDEKTYDIKELIIGKNVPHNNVIYYITSGECRERLHKYTEDDVEKGHAMKLKSGTFACL